jgi:hypothetical protein
MTKEQKEKIESVSYALEMSGTEYAEESLNNCVYENDFDDFDNAIAEIENLIELYQEQVAILQNLE